MTLVRFNQPAVNRRLANEAYFSNLWDSFLGSAHDFSHAEEVNYQVKEEDSLFALELAVPGLTKADLSVEVENGVLRVQTVASEENTGSAFAKPFKKQFRLAKSIQQDAIEAQVEHGVLYITLPKKEEAVPKPARSIEIA